MRKNPAARLSQSPHEVELHPTAASPRRRLATILIALCLATLVVYARTLLQDFVDFDDNKNFYQNPYLTPVPDLNILHYFQHAYFQMYIPVSYTAFALIGLGARMSRPDQAVTRVGLLDPRLFHAVGLGLHIACVVLVFFLLRRLIAVFTSAAEPTERAEQARDYAAAAGAAFFALHPVQVETVAWASQLRGLICALFSLAALFVYLAREERSPLRTAYAICLGLVAMLAKPSAATLPLIALILDRWIAGRLWKSALPPAILWLACIAPLVVIAGRVQPTASLPEVPLWARPVIAADALAFYLGKLFWPVSLGVDYGRTPSVVLAHPWGYVTWIAPTGVAAAIFLTRRRFPWLVASGLVSLAVLAPVLGLTPFIYQGISTVADRYLYLALLGPAIALAFSLETMQASSSPDVRRAARPASIATGIMLTACLLLTARQMSFWDDSETLMNHSLSINPDSFVSHLGLADALSSRRAYAAADKQYRAAIALKPDYAAAHTHYGTNLCQEDDFSDAAAEFQTGMRLDPNTYDVHNGLGLIALHSKDFAGAAREFRQAIALFPTSAVCYNNLGKALQAEGRLSEALSAEKTAARIDPFLVPAFAKIADISLMQGDAASAIDNYRKAIALDPDFVPAYDGLSQAYLRQGDSGQATQALQEALARNPDYAPAQQHLRALLKH